MKMNLRKKIVSSSLKILPNFIKNRAAARVLSLLVPAQSISSSDLDINILLSDINESFSVNYNGELFTAKKIKNPDVIIKTSLDKISHIATKQHLIQAIDSHEIDISSNTEQPNQISTLITEIDELQFITTIEKIYTTLRIPHLIPARYNWETLTIDDISKPYEIDYLRDQALEIETHNLALARKIMAIAHQARPTGTVIKAKLDEYDRRLAKMAQS